MRAAWVVFSVLSLAAWCVYLVAFRVAGDVTDAAFLFVTLTLALGVLLMDLVVRLCRRTRIPTWLRTLVAVVLSYHACFGLALALSGLTGSPRQVLTKLYPHVVSAADSEE